MSKNKKIIISILVVLIIVIGVIVAYKLIENSVTNREDFKFNVENISSNPVATVNHEKSEYSFCGTITQVEDNLFFVKPDENEEIRKSADLIMVEKLKQDTNVKYEIGEKIKITYDGDVMETYPAQIKAIKYERISSKNFEIMFSNKKPTDSYRVYTILSKTETDKYDYTIYGYDGIVKIKIDGKDYLLKDALLENKITMEEIIEKANKDFPNAASYDDGGSKKYHYENYTIIKCHRLDGNRDVYIGTKEMTLNDVI